MYEPIWSEILEKPPPPITLAPGLKESQLLMMAQARALERLGFISLNLSDQYGAHWSLTPKGLEAVRYWREAMLEHIQTERTEPSPT